MFHDKVNKLVRHKKPSSLIVHCESGVSSCQNRPGSMTFYILAILISVKLLQKKLPLILFYKGVELHLFSYFIFVVATIVVDFLRTRIEFKIKIKFMKRYLEI